MSSGTRSSGWTPGHYLTSSYYEHWLTAAATLAVEHGLVTREDLEARAGGAFPLSGPVLAPPVTDAGPDRGEPRFGIGRPGAGARVAPARPHPLPPLHPRQDRRRWCGWTAAIRCPTSRHTAPPAAHEPTYSVRFDAAELWCDGQRGVCVHVDLWDSYLEPA